jgi:dTDP-4-amino-4,6-dideoxygalactose transaminase
MKTIPHSAPWIEDDDIEAILVRAKSTYVGFSVDLEAEIAKNALLYINKKFFQTTSSGTLALYFALRHSRSSTGKNEVIISSINCWAVYNSVIQAGYDPIICDVRSESDFRADYNSIKGSITSKTSAIVITHMFGHLIEAVVLQKLKQEHPEITIIEDYASSFGATYGDGTLIGQYSDFVITSFASTKQITGGVGGGIACDQRILEFDYDRRNRGVQIALNANLSSLDQTLLLSQLKKIGIILKKKKKVIDFYSQYLKIYGYSSGCSLYRAITFQDCSNLCNRLADVGISLDIRKSVQPNISRELKQLSNNNAMQFDSYFSLPLNRIVYDEFRILALIS